MDLWYNKQKTESNHILMGRQSKIRSYTKIRCLLLLPVNNKEVSRIPTSCQNCVTWPMTLGRIFWPIFQAASFRSPLQYPKRHCISTPIMTWPKQWDYLRDTGEEAHLCSNGPQKQIYYHKWSSVLPDRGSKDGDRLFSNALRQQLPSLIPVYHPFMDLPHMEIHARKEPIFRRNYGSPYTARIEWIVYYGRHDGNGDQRESFGRAKHM